MEAAATTCPTSCTEAPTHAPNSVAVSPSSEPRPGKVKIASVPHNVTSAMEYATSSSLASANGSTAAMADAPQML